jgi:hypothetical protein
VHVPKEANGGYRGGTHCFDVNGKEITHPNHRPNTVHVGHTAASLSVVRAPAMFFGVDHSAGGQSLA